MRYKNRIIIMLCLLCACHFTKKNYYSSREEIKNVKLNNFLTKEALTSCKHLTINKLSQEKIKQITDAFLEEQAQENNQIIKASVLVKEIPSGNITSIYATEELASIFKEQQPIGILIKPLYFSVYLEKGNSIDSFFPSPKDPLIDSSFPDPKNPLENNKSKWDSEITVKDAFAKNFAGTKRATNLLELYEDTIFINQFLAFNLPLKNKNEILHYALSLSEIADVYSVFFNNGEECVFNFCLDKASKKTNKQIIPTTLNNQIEALLTYRMQENSVKFQFYLLGKEELKVKGMLARVNNNISYFIGYDAGELVAIKLENLNGEFKNARSPALELWTKLKE